MRLNAILDNLKDVLHCTSHADQNPVRVVVFAGGGAGGVAGGVAGGGAGGGAGGAVVFVVIFLVITLLQIDTYCHSFVITSF